MFKSRRLAAPVTPPAAEQRAHSRGDAHSAVACRRARLFVMGLMVLAVAVLGAAGGIGYIIHQQIEGYVVAAREQPYEVPAGSTARQISQELVADPLLQPWLALYLRLHPELTAIQRGEYVINGSQTLRAILQDMVSGRVFVRQPATITIVEGMSLAMVRARLASAYTLRQRHPEDPHVYDLLPADQQVYSDVPALLRSVLVSPAYQALYPANLTSLEGLLLPATYPFAEGDSELHIIRHALEGMARYLAPAWESRDPSCHLANPYEALILASIVERESALDAERALIAGVFCNRLRQGIRLQTDPAVMYGVGPLFRGPLHRSHLLRDTPYNTYTRAGLPPTPIAMPSVKSIAAVLHPAATEALYFVAADVDPKLGHIFTSTLDEHNRAAAVYRQKVRAYKLEQRRQGGAESTESPGPAPASGAGPGSEQ